MSLKCPNPQIRDLLVPPSWWVLNQFFFLSARQSIKRSVSHLYWSWLRPQSLGKSSLTCQTGFLWSSFDFLDQVLQFSPVLGHLQFQIIFTYCPDFLIVLCMKVCPSFPVCQYKQALLLCCCVVLDKSFPVSGPQVSHLLIKGLDWKTFPIHLSALFLICCLYASELWVRWSVFTGKAQFFLHSAGILPHLVKVTRKALE